MPEFQNKAVAKRFSGYPSTVRSRLLALRKLVFEAASDLGISNEIEETLKWGEPSYLTRKGSTLRLDWKESTPEQYFMYFHCRTKLVDTFKELYGDRFEFVGNRAIVFCEHEEVPKPELMHCISMTLNYHRLKHLPLLGA